MPDVHAGAGCVIGFTGDLGDKVIPNIVGVDIGCGMRVAKLGNMPEIDYHKFNEHILANVPSGMIVREEKLDSRNLWATKWKSTAKQSNLFCSYTATVN